MAALSLMLAVAAGRPPPPPPPPAPAGVRSYSQHAFTKVRPESLLRHDPAAQAERPDLRGAWERARDAEVARHFARLAELDVIAAHAQRLGEAGLAEAAEEVRRQENERYTQAMRRLRERAWQAP